MKAAVLHEPRDLRLDEVPDPTLGAGEVRVRVRTVGICGSDVHYWRTGRIGEHVLRSPMILGHEAAGVVEEVAPDVSSLRPGDRVALEPGVPCRRCEWCKTGRYNLCPDVVFMATPPVDGALAEYVVSPADFAYRLPNEVSFDAAALVEPLSVAIHACRRGHVELGQSVFIAGAGPIGIVTLMTARAYGATRVMVSDVRTERLELARSLGADVVNAAEQNVAEAVAERTNGRGFDVAVECAGSEPALSDCLRAATRGGTIVVVGLGDQDTYAVPVTHLTAKELDLRGVFRYVHTYPAALSAIASGTVDVERMITHRFPFGDLLTGFEYAEHGTDGAVKVMIDV